MEDRVVDSLSLREELSKLPKQKGFSSGYQSIDYYLGEFREGDLTIITGLTGEGKTQLAVSLTRKFAKQNIPSLWFSYEISSSELMERFGQELPLFYLPRLLTSKADEWIEKKIEEGIQKYGIKAVFLDHLHYVVDQATARNRNVSEILGSMCRQFKMIARKHRIMFFVLAHTRKVKGDAQRPTIDDLKDSSGIAQEADTVMIIQRKGRRRSKKADADEIPELSTDVRIWIDKNRRTGRLGVIDMMYDPKDGIHKEDVADEEDKAENVVLKLL